MENERNEVYVSFFMVKFCVVLFKLILICCLELIVVVIFINVVVMFKSEFDINNIQCYYYIDFEIVIGYINNDVCRFYVYVGNCVQYIRDCSFLGDWFYILGKENLVDEVFYGLIVKELL